MRVFLGIIFSFNCLTANTLASSIDQYASAFPLFMQYCGASKIEPKVGEPGGFGGHAVLYVHGLCKNENIDYPRVEACTRIPQQKTPHAGVGISVDKYFKNVNWVAVPGYEFFIHGDLSSKDKVTESAQVNIVEKVLATDIFKGVLYDEMQVSRDLLNKKDRSYETETATLALGTDFALTWGRDLECLRLPITEPQLYAVRDYLNRLNEKHYQHPDKPFEWSAYYNNCTHTSSNAFATIGARDYIETDSNMFWQTLHLANPANPLMTLQYKSQREAIELSAIEPNGYYEQTFKDYHWLPAGAGALTVHHPVFKKNELFKTELSAFVLPPKPLHRSYQVWDFHNNEAQSPNNTDLSKNLRMWISRYQSTLQELQKKHVFSGSSTNRNALLNYYRTAKKSAELKLKRLNTSFH